MRLTKAAGIGLVMLSLSACAGSAGADRGSTAPSIRPQAAAAVFHGFRVAMTTALGQRDVGTMRRLETGAALAESLAAVRTAGVQPNVTLSLEHDLGPVTIYPSAGASYPQWFLASSPYSDDPGRTEFDIFTRDSAADPWMESFHTLATAHVLEPPRLRAGAL